MANTNSINNNNNKHLTKVILSNSRILVKTGFKNHFNGFTTQFCFAGDQYVQPTVNHHVPRVLPPPTVNHYTVQDPILQYQPQLGGNNQYDIKRETLPKVMASIGNDNPFLRRPKKLVFQNRQNRHDDGRQGWIPIPYPIYKK
jgi:hypothetical protein